MVGQLVVSFPLCCCFGVFELWYKSNLWGCLNIPCDIRHNRPLQVEVKATTHLSKLPSAPQQLVKFWLGGHSTARTMFSLLPCTKERK